MCFFLPPVTAEGRDISRFVVLKCWHMACVIDVIPNLFTNRIKMIFAQKAICAINKQHKLESL